MEQLSPIKKALAKVQSLRQQVTTLQSIMHEPIAIVGIGCRYPGGIQSATQFWEMLEAGRDLITELPPQRWPSDLYDPTPGVAGKTYCKWGGFIENLPDFDADFFNIAPREAELLDPQQRMLLETTWQALEDSGLNREQVRDSRTGVFVGLCGDDYAQLCQAADPLNLRVAHRGMGTARSIAAGRVAYVFGLQGPVLQVDTSCSSSLSALHLAVNSLRSGECDRAVVAGVNVALTPELTIGLSELRALSPDGRCRTFDAGANGYVRGEGCGVLVLKRQTDACADGDRIYASVRGMAMNHDGRSNGLTAPNGKAQEAVIREALSNAAADPTWVNVVEAHGTGTPLGDPIELNALHRSYCQGQMRPQPLWVGSLKTNFGHLEGAASVAAVTKIALALYHKKLPPSLNFETPSPHFDWSDEELKVVTQCQPWPVAEGKPALAGVSAFGMSGTNVHAILEEAPAAINSDVVTPQSQMSSEIITLSGHTPEALLDNAQRLHDFLHQQNSQQNELPLSDLAAALREQRDHWPYRFGFICRTHEELSLGLKMRLQDKAAMPSDPPPHPRIAFLFTGQGAQYIGMGVNLYRRFAVFKAAIDECDVLFQRQTGFSLLDVLWGERRAEIGQTRWTQPAVFALQYGLIQLWRAWGVQPDIVLGHSIGEFAAAYCSGVMDLATAMRLVSLRGQLMAQQTEPGAMYMVAEPLARVQQAIEPFRDCISIAADNAELNVVIAGQFEPLKAVVNKLEAEGAHVKQLKVSHAFHSPLMTPMLPEWRRHLQDAELRSPEITFISSCTGMQISEALCDPEYWVTQVSASVQFREAVLELQKLQPNLGLELGPSNTLLGLVRAGFRDSAEADSLRWIASLDREQADDSHLQGALGQVYEAGVDVPWTDYRLSLFNGRPPNPVTLPPYALQRRAYWVAKPPLQPQASGASGRSLVGSPLSLAGSEQIRFDAHLGVAIWPWLKGHRVRDQIYLPAAAVVDMLLLAVRESAPAAIHVRIEKLVLERPITLGDSENLWTRVQTVLEADALGRYRVQQFATAPSAEEMALSRPTWAPTSYAECTLDDTTEMALPDWETLRQACSQSVSVAALYQSFEEVGLSYSGCFRSLQKVWLGTDCAVAEIELSQDVQGLDSCVHPGLLDAALQIVGALLPTKLYLPSALLGVRLALAATPTRLLCAVHSLETTDGVQARVDLYYPDGRPFGCVERLQLTPVSVAASPPSLHQMAWHPFEPVAQPTSEHAQTYLICGEPSAATAGQTLTQSLSGLGCQANWLPLNDETMKSEPELIGQLEAALKQRPIGHDEKGKTIITYVWPQQEAALETEPTFVEHCFLRFAAFWKALQSQALSQSWGSLLIVTQYGQTLMTDADSIRPQQAVAWGVGRCLAQEHPQIPVYLLDLDQWDGAALMLAVADERQMLVRGGQSFVPRLQPVMDANASPESKSPECKVKPIGRGTYLVTGASGGLGSRLVRWLLQQGAEKVLAVSRSGLPKTLWTELQLLAQQQGGTLENRRLDVADADQVAGLNQSLGERDQPALKGIFHTAGVLQDGLFIDMEPAQVRTVLAPKVTAGYLLHQMAQDHTLDHFVVFSSVTSVLGSAGQSNYAAANAYLDALALQRHHQGQPALSVNWGAWAGDGMAANLDAQAQSRMQSLGIGMLPADEGVALWQTLFAEQQGQILAWQVDVRRLHQHLSAVGNRMLVDLQPPIDKAADKAACTAAQPDGAAPDVASLRALPAEQAVEQLQHYLLQQLATILSRPAGAISPSKPLINLGLDSLMAVELRTRLRQQLGLDLAMARLLEGATLTDIAKGVLQTPSSDPGGSSEVNVTTTTTIAAVSIEAQQGKELEMGEL